MKVDVDSYINFSKVIVHIFRNVFDIEHSHSLESIKWDNLDKGKIHCKLKISDEGKISLTVSEGDQGINVNRLRMKAVEKGIYDEQTALKISDTEAINLIFHSHFLEDEELIRFLQKEVERFTVEHEFEETPVLVQATNNGTVFHFLLPIISKNNISSASLQEVFHPLINKTTSFFEEQCRLSLIENSFDIQQNDTLDLRGVTCFIHMKGNVEGVVIMTMDKPLAIHVMKQLVLDEIMPHEEDILVEGVLAESLNIIIGNCIPTFTLVDQYIRMVDSPVTLRAEELASLQYDQSEVCSTSLQFDEGNVNLSFVLLNSH